MVLRVILKHARMLRQMPGCQNRTAGPTTLGCTSPVALLLDSSACGVCHLVAKTAWQQRYSGEFAGTCQWPNTSHILAKFHMGI